MRELVASSAIYTAAFTPKPGFTKEATTVGLWLLDENMGTMTADTSGLGYDGTIAGGATWAAECPP
jgi:hypothetical protein